MKGFFYKSAATGALATGLSIGAAEAEDARAQMIADLDLPVGKAAHYIDQGQKTAITERCEEDGAMRSAVTCRMTIIGHGPKLYMTQDVVYIAGEAGAPMHIDVRMGASRKKTVDDNHQYGLAEERASTFDGAASTLMTNGMGARWGIDKAYGGIVALSAQGGAQVTLGSYVGINEKRGFLLKNEWDHAGGTVHGSVTPLVASAQGVLAPSVIQPASRDEWTRYDSDNFEYYHGCAVGGGVIDYSGRSELCVKPR